MKDKKTIIGEATPEEINFWKQKFGEITAIIVRGHICYLRKPDRKTIGYALSQIEIAIEGTTKINLGQMARIGETVLQNCWIGGSDEIRKDDDLYMIAAGKAGELIKFGEEAELKKL